MAFPRRRKRPRWKSSPTTYCAPSMIPHAMLQPISAISSSRAPPRPSSSMMIPAPSVKVSVMMSPNMISPRLSAGSRKRCMSDERVVDGTASTCVHRYLTVSERREIEEQRDHQVHGEKLHALVPVPRPAGRDDRSDQHGEEE